MGESVDLPPVVVVGAGPVGLTAALLLARWQVPVVLLDGRPARDRIGSKAICQHRDVLDVWDSVGARIAERGITWNTARTFYGDRELFAVHFTDRGRSPFPPFVNISQADTEDVLEALVRAHPLIDLRWSHTVDRIDQRARGASVLCANGATVEASYVLACPGARAELIRDPLGITFDGRSFGDKFLICDIRTDLPDWEHERRFYFDPAWNPGRQVLVHPCPASTFRIDWQVPDEYDLDRDERTGGLDRRIRRIIGDRPYSIVWRSVYRFHSRLASRFRVGRVLLAGDAAHLMSPFRARGLNSGVLDAENAAWKIAFVLRGWAPEDLLDSYDLERRAAAQENLDVTGATMRFLVPATDAEHAHRHEVLEAAATDPAARALVDSGRLAESFWYTDSPLTTPDPSRPAAGRPERGHLPQPGPGVLTPDVPVEAPDAHRLHQLARSRVAVLRFGAPEPDLAGLPARAYDADTLDPGPLLRAALDAHDGEYWVLRPDAHVAAVVTRAAAVAPAIRRLLANPVPAADRPVPVS